MVRKLLVLLEVSERTMYYNLKRLAEEGLIGRVGACKTVTGKLLGKTSNIKINERKRA